MQAGNTRLLYEAVMEDRYSFDFSEKKRWASNLAHPDRLLISQMAYTTNTADLFARGSGAVIAYRTCTRDFRSQLVIDPYGRAACAADIYAGILIMEFCAFEIAKATDGHFEIVGYAGGAHAARAAQIHTQSFGLDVIEFQIACAAEGNSQLVSI